MPNRSRDRYIDFEYLTGCGDDNFLLDIEAGITFGIEEVHTMPWTGDPQGKKECVTVGLVVG